MLTLVTLALATPLDLAKADALALIDACGHGEAAACVTLAASAERAAAASVVDHAWGNDEIAVYRLQQANVYLAAACEAGEEAACRAEVERADACMGEVDCASELNDALQATLEAQCRFGTGLPANEGPPPACVRLEHLGWRGVVRELVLHGGLDPAPPAPEGPPVPPPGVDSEGRTHRFKRVVPSGGGWIGFADRSVEAAGRPPGGETRVLAWVGAEGVPQTLLVVPFTGTSVVNADGEFVSWSVGAEVSRARIVRAPDGRVSLTDVRTLAASGRTGAYPVPIESLSLAHDGAALFVADGEGWVWRSGAPSRLGVGQQVVATGEGAALVERAPGGATALHLYDVHAAEVGVVRLPPDSYLRPGSDGTALVLTSGFGWAEVDVGDRAAPAWGVPDALAAARAGPSSAARRSPAPASPTPVFTDSAGIPLAGVDLGGRDALGGVVRTDIHGVAGTPTGPVGGRDGLARLDPGAASSTLLSEGEVRARALAAGPGVQLARTPVGLRVDGIEPGGLWSALLTVGRTYSVLAAPPTEGWTGARLWAEARAAWPERGARVLPVDAKSGLPNGPPVELPGGLPCAWVRAAYRTLDSYCPNPALVGTHLVAVPAATWATLDLVQQLAGTWDAIDPARDRRERVRARVEALYADPGSPALEGVDPSEETEAVALASLLLDQDDPAGILNAWFKVPKEPVPPVVIGVRGAGLARKVTWNGRAVAAAAFADEVRVPGVGPCGWLFFADPDTFVYCGDVYVRRR